MHDREDAYYIVEVRVKGGKLWAICCANCNFMAHARTIELAFLVGQAHQSNCKQLCEIAA